MDSSRGTSERNIKYQHKSLIHQSSYNTLKRQVAEQFLAPSNVLNYERIVKRQKPELLSASLGMDKRHPSSFQQLEKVMPCYTSNK